jgi:MFS family permease
VLTEALGWEWVLFVNVPIAAAAAALTFSLIAESRSPAAVRAFDLPGAAAVTAGLSAAVYAIVGAESVGWGSPRTIGLFALAAVLLAGFVAIERRSKAPLVPFDVFRLRTVLGANVAMFVVGAAMFGLFFFLSIYMQAVLGYTALESGVAQLPLAGTIVLAAGAVSPLVTRFGSKPVLLAGLVLFAGGMGWFSLMPADGSFLADLLGPSLLVGLGLAASFIALTITSVEGVGEHQYGLASGLINTTQQIGGALGLAVLAAVANGRTSGLLERGSESPAALTEGFQLALLVGAGFVVAAIALAALLSGGTKPHTATGSRPQPVAA